jgi:hypothetical protein
MKSRLLWALPLLLLCLSPNSLHAQAKFAIYGTFGGEKSGLPNVGWTTAETFGLYVGFANIGPLAFSVDGRADLSSKIKTGLVGPRLAVHLPAFPLKPYAEILIGASTYATFPDGLKDSGQFATRADFGADTAILPHLDWRIADFSYGINNSANGDHAKTLSSGLVLRL